MRSNINWLIEGIGEYVRAGLEFLLGSEKLISTRVEQFYHGHDEFIQEKTEEVLLAQKKRAFILAVIWLLVVIFSVHSAVKDEGIIVSESGNVLAIKRPDENSGMRRVDAEVMAVQGDGKSMSKAIQIRVEPVGTEAAPPSSRSFEAESEAMVFDRQVQTEIRKLNEVKADKVVLPTEMEDGRKLVWKVRKPNRIPLIVGLLLAGILFLYGYRFKEVDAVEKAALQSVVSELPSFINHIVLLLKSGLIFSEAFNRAVDSNKERSAGEAETYFQGQIYRIKNSCSQSNAQIDDELLDFARRTQLTEVLRMVGIIKENLKMGTDLTEKLEEENMNLWFARKRDVERMGGVAETQLSIPLVMNLMVLILITIAPALLDM